MSDNIAPSERPFKVSTSGDQDDGRHGPGPLPFAIIPAYVLVEATPNAVKLYGALALRANLDTGECWGKHETWKADTGLSVSTVRRALDELVTLGAIERFHRKTRDGKQRANRYRLPFAINRRGADVDALDDDQDDPDNVLVDADDLDPGPLLTGDDQDDDRCSRVDSGPLLTGGQHEPEPLLEPDKKPPSVGSHDRSDDDWVVVVDESESPDPLDGPALALAIDEARADPAVQSATGAGRYRFRADPERYRAEVRRRRRLEVARSCDRCQGRNLIWFTADGTETTADDPDAMVSEICSHGFDDPPARVPEVATLAGVGIP